MPFTAAEIAKHLGGKVVGDGKIVLSGLSQAETAKEGDLTFAENTKYFGRAEQSAASAIIAAGDVTSASKVVIRVSNARLAFAKVLPLFFPEPQFAPGIHSTAIIAKSAKLDSSVHVGPYCMVGEHVQIGARCVLQGGNFIGESCRVAEGVNLFPNVTVYPLTKIGRRVRVHAGTVIGSDGFGYVHDHGVHHKVPQVGSVVIGDDVEIGANVTIDRGALGATIIGKGTKIDNLVQIAHNVRIGEHCLIIAQVGIAGSCEVGNYVVLAGQVGIADHLKIGDQAVLGAQSGVITDIPNGETWFGYPAQPQIKIKRQLVALQKLPDLLKRVNEIERKLGPGSKSEK